MDAKRLLLTTVLFPMLLGGCRSNEDTRSPVPALRDSLGVELLGLSSEDCAALNGEYIVALQEARVCNPLIRPKQCTVLVSSELACPCVVYVNPRNTEAIAKMRAASKAWDAGGCSTLLIDCPTLICQRPKAAECAAVGSEDHPGSNGGGCLDVF